jgi:hypothetical protein
MTIDQILQKLDTERTLGSRFPVRLIFVEQLGQYEDLVSCLTNVCDITINIADLCSADDIYPSFRKLQVLIGRNKGKHVLVLSMGEYLRFRIKKETQPEKANFPSFWQTQQESSSRTRVIVPLFASQELFERVVPQIDDRQKDNICVLNPSGTEHKSFSVSVFSPDFGEVISCSVKGFRNWLGSWVKEYSRTDKCAMVTALYPNIENSNGLVNINVIDNPFDYVCSLVSDGYRLKKEWASDELWAELIQHVLKKEPFCKTIESVLNVKTFDSISILAKWDILSPLQRQLVWIWYQLNDTGDYCGYVFRNAKNTNSIERDLRDAIIRGNHKPEWIAERMQIMKVLKTVSFDSEYFKLLDTLPLPETRLHLLTYETHEERTYAIKTISQWLRQGVSVAGVLEALNGRYPLFEQYLTENIDGYTDLNKYLSWYRYFKVINRIPDTTPETLNLDSFDSRYMLLSKYQGKDCLVLWIDGMGVEWLPLLLKCLDGIKSIADITTHVAAALLPTETEFNEQWRDFDYPYEKWNRLDALSHKGMPDDSDYFSCIDNQLSVIAEVAKRAEALLSMHDYVIITADHGSSRIAALSFHDTFGVPAPKKAVVKSFGRVCELHEPVSVTDMLPYTYLSKSADTEYLIMTTHDHYSVSGNAAGGNDDNNAVCGEIHGGMTPEEYLVPVVVLKRRIGLAPLEYSLKSDTVYRDKGNVKIELLFSRDVSTLEVSVDTTAGMCEKVTPRAWTVTFQGLETREYQTEVIANGSLINKQAKFIVKSKGIAKNNDPFGGF